MIVDFEVLYGPAKKKVMAMFRFRMSVYQVNVNIPHTVEDVCVGDKISGQKKVMKQYIYTPKTFLFKTCFTRNK